MHNHYVQLLLHYLHTHPRTTHLFIFLTAFTESLPIIGTIVPGSITMTVVGVLIGAGSLPLTLSLSIASIGAFAGDTLGFLVGYHYNDRIRGMWPFRKYPQWLEKGERFFEKHGGKSIIIGRFAGPARSTVPLIAGLLHLKFIRFACAAIPSAVLWAILYMVPGIFLGALSKEVPAGETTKFFFIAGGLLVAAWLTYWVIQYFFKQIVRMINRSTDRLWAYLSRKKASHWFIRLLINQQRPEDHHQLTLFLAAILSGILFLVLLCNVRSQASLVMLNHPLFHLLQSIRTPFFNKFFAAITILGMPKTTLIIVIFLTALLGFKKQWRSAAHCLGVFVVASGAVFVFKYLSHSIRPQGFHFVSTSNSFPSGHAALSFVVFGFMAFLVTQIVTKKWRWAPYSIAALLIFSVGLSRLYLGAHWLTDIIGSFFLGLTLLFLCIVNYRRMPKSRGAFSLKPKTAWIIVFLSLALPWSISLPLEFAKTVRHTTPIWPTISTTTHVWWQSPLSITPTYRNNRLGQPFHHENHGCLVFV